MCHVSRPQVQKGEDAESVGLIWKFNLEMCSLSNQMKDTPLLVRILVQHGWTASGNNFTPTQYFMTETVMSCTVRVPWKGHRRKIFRKCTKQQYSSQHKSNQHINQTDKPELPTSLQPDLLSRFWFLKCLSRKCWIKFRIGRSWASIQNSRYLYCLVCARSLKFGCRSQTLFSAISLLWRL